MKHGSAAIIGDSVAARATSSQPKHKPKLKPKPASSRKPKRLTASGHYRLEFGDCRSAFCLPVDTPARES